VTGVLTPAADRSVRASESIGLSDGGPKEELTSDDVVKSSWNDRTAPVASDVAAAGQSGLYLLR
jgi:hypothetical protein